MSTVFIESPYAGDVAANEEYATKAMLTELEKGNAPIVTHLLWTQVWDDMDQTTRERALQNCRKVRRQCDGVVFYLDRGISHGMRRSIHEAVRDGLEISWEIIEYPYRGMII